MTGKEAAGMLREYRRLSMRIKDAMAALDQEDREIIKYFHFVPKHEKYWEFSASLGITKSALYRRHARALRRLAEQLEAGMERERVRRKL